jgi:hypothetical protein
VNGSKVEVVTCRRCGVILLVTVDGQPVRGQGGQELLLTDEGVECADTNSCSWRSVDRESRERADGKDVQRMRTVPSFQLRDETGDVVAKLPGPRVLGALLLGGIEANVAGMRATIAAGGGVVAREDVFELQRWLQSTRELLAEYQRVLGGVGKHIGGIVEEVLVDAVGEQDGVPMDGMTVPDRDGDIKITRDMARTHHIDADLVFPVLAAEVGTIHAPAVLNATDTTPGMPATEQLSNVATALAEAILDALGRLGEVGKFEPQVSKVKTYAKTVARNGDDRAASILSESIRTTASYRGVTVKRETPK